MPERSTAAHNAPQVRVYAHDPSFDDPARLPGIKPFAEGRHAPVRNPCLAVAGTCVVTGP